MNPQGDSKQRFGHIPFHRDEYTAGSITASFILDLEEIRSFGLSQDESNLLVLVSLYKISSLLGKGLRLRTACDLDVTAVNAKKPEGFILPEQANLENAIRTLIANIAENGGFAGITTVRLTPSAGKKNPKSSTVSQEQGE